MRGLMRILIMFGPMIFRQIQKMQRNSGRRQQQQYPNQRRQQIPQQRDSRQGRMEGTPRHDRGQHVEQLKDLNEELGVNEEAKNFELRDEEIMLDKEDLRHSSAKVDAAAERSIEDVIKSDGSQASTPEPAPKSAPKPPKKDSDLDLKDLFLD